MMCVGVISCKCVSCVRVCVCVCVCVHVCVCLSVVSFVFECLYMYVFM